MSLDAWRSPNGEIRQGSFRIESGRIGRALGLPPPRVFAVPANTLIVADTFGFHARGPSVGRSLRVEVWAYGRRSPFVPWARSIRGPAPPWPGAASSAGGSATLLDRAGITPHALAARIGVSAFDPA